MAEQRDVIENPVTGQTIIFRRRARDTGGELLQFEMQMQPDRPRTPEHVHPYQEERVEVLSGTVRYRLGGQEYSLGPGEAVALPPRIPHTLWNASDEEAQVLFDVRPALKTETAFETLFGLARDGKTNRQGIPNPLQGAVLAREYETFLPWPPLPMQRAAVAALAPIAKLFGYRVCYPEYSGPV